MLNDLQVIELEPHKGCNLKCKMCHTTYLNEPDVFLDFDRISDFSFFEGKTVRLGAVFEAMIHPQINKIITILNEHHCKLQITTNATNLNFKKIPALRDSDIMSIHISFDGISKETYESIRVGAKYEKVLENIREIKNAFRDKGTLFVINYTVFACNVDEIKDAPQFWEQFGIEHIGFIPMVIRNEDEFLEKNSVWYVKDKFEENVFKAAQAIIDKDLYISIGSHFLKTKKAVDMWGDLIRKKVSNVPRMEKVHIFEFSRLRRYEDNQIVFPCGVPFVTLRITWEGNVNLCHNKVIGNLYKNTFDEILNSEAAEKLRNSFYGDDSICHKCDFFKFCVNGGRIDIDDINSYYSADMLEKIASRGLKKA